MRTRVRRREFIILLGGAAATWPLRLSAQQAGMPLIGVMSPLSVSTAARNLSALRDGLRKLGYTEGRNITIESRFADVNSERYSTLVADLIALKPAVILVGSTAGVLAAHKVTRTIPLIWFGSVDDPVALGLVESFARPGGNVTGCLLSSAGRMVTKRLELLLEAVPGVSRIGVLLAPDYATADGTIKWVSPAARGLNVNIGVYQVQSDAELEAAFATAVRDGMQALYISEAPHLLTRRAEIAAKVASVRLPAMYSFREYVESGGLMSYGSDLPDLYRRAAAYVDRVLKGASPGELPLESAERFELVINLKTANALGLTIPPTLLARADQVIE